MEVVNFLPESLQKENEAENKMSVPSVAIPLNQTQELSFPWELKWLIGLLRAAHLGR